MSKHVTIWHNPRCSKSREALKLLEARDLDVTVRRYLDDAPSAAELEAVLERLGVEPRDLMRTKDALYRELDLGRAELGRDELIAAMVEHPALIERPVVIAETGVVLGRPPEKVHALFDDGASS